MFENKLVKGIHISRYIMSWARVGGPLNYRGKGYTFGEWLETLEIDGSKLSEEEIHDIMFIAQNGKLELEESAREFIRTENIK